MTLSWDIPELNLWIKSWLKEDIASGDITTEALIPHKKTGHARIVAKAEGVLCGVELFENILKAMGQGSEGECLLRSGDRVSEGVEVLRFSADYASLLKMERTFLNLIQRLSGISTLTRVFVDAIAHTHAKILDTRKTTPGLRLLEKKAVLAGGAVNHRIGLFDQFLIKENHLSPFREKANPFMHTVGLARAYRPDVFVTIEVESIEECSMALESSADVILLDNLSAEALKACVQLRNGSSPKTLLEASGGIDMQSLVEVAETGVDRISVGAITHSARSLDLSMLLDV